MSLFVALSAWSDVTVSVTGTATNSAGMGYTKGTNYTFSWTINAGYEGCAEDDFDSDQNRWNAEETSDPLLWADVSGDGLNGTYRRPSGSSWAPFDQFVAKSDGLALQAGNDDSSTCSMGLTVNGVDLRYLEVDGVTASGLDLDYSATDFVNPATWAADYAGTYDSGVSEDAFHVRDEDEHITNFTATSFEIVPEPISVGLFAGAGLIFAFYRRFFV